MIILNDQSQEKTSIKQSNITTRISTNIGTNKQNLEELKKQTLLNILSAKGVIYTYYKLKKERESYAHRQIHNTFYGLYLEEWKTK